MDKKRREARDKRTWLKERWVVWRAYRHESHVLFKDVRLE